MRAIRLGAVVLTTLGLWAALATATASAGEYTVYSCLRPIHLPDPVWQTYQDDLVLPADWKDHMQVVPRDGFTSIGRQDHLASTDNDCGTVPNQLGVDVPGSLFMHAVTTTTDDMPRVIETGVTFDAPPGTTIAGYEITKQLNQDSLFSGAVPYFERWLDGSSAPQLQEEVELSSGHSTIAGTSAQDELPANVTALRLLVGCRVPQINAPSFTCKSDARIRSEARIASMRLELSESSPPATSSIGGSLITDSAQALNGTKTLSFQATDAQSGVYRAVIEFDGRPVATKVFGEAASACRDAGVDDSNDYEFDARVPCAPAVNAVMELDADRLHQGVHELRAYVEDAAGNEAGLIGPTEVVVSGSQAAIRSCEPCNGSGGDPRSGRIVVGEPRSKLRVRSGKRLELDGKVIDASGTPVSNAQVDVLQRIRLPRQSFRQVKALTTDDRGRFTFAPATTSSRTIRFAFAPRRGSDIYASTSDTEVAVLSTISLSAKRRRIKPYGLLRLRGHVNASPLERGVPLQVQAREGRSWRTIAVTRTNQKGDLAFNYRFRYVTRGRFEFRALAIESSDLPIEPTASRAVAVRVGRR